MEPLLEREHELLMLSASASVARSRASCMRLEKFAARAYRSNSSNRSSGVPWRSVSWTQRL